MTAVEMESMIHEKKQYSGRHTTQKQMCKPNTGDESPKGKFLSMKYLIVAALKITQTSCHALSEMHLARM